MPFNAARSKLASTQQQSLDGLLAEWDVATDVPPQAAKNLRGEHGMSAANLQSYLTTFADSHTALSPSGTGPKAEFERIGNPFLLAGHAAAPFQGAVFGRAIRLEIYAGFLKPSLDSLKCYDTEEEIRATLRTLGDKQETSVPTVHRIYLEAMRRTNLGKEVLFATFAKPVAQQKRPWTTPATSTDVCASCGLGEVPAGKELILFVYRLPDGISPRVPTTASPGWAYQKWFRPNPKAATELHGWTEPIGTGFAKRPEIVHSEIDGTTILFPIHIATA